ncbi:MAG TPA: sigma-70 family RNA polymerase sigma factor [Myxococcaceae bacterium]|nr:sigma-70 family RNA polymerase sigma factor [Myxococcaceae bacterium]
MSGAAQARVSRDKERTAEAFEEHRRLLWSLCYRMTGVAADADELVQETFLRMQEARPSRDEPLRPWLVKVAVNLSRDALRRRRRREYVGPWLPSPVDLSAEEVFATQAAPDDLEARLELRDTGSYAFLLAAEALTPTQRAVVLLCEVLDYSGKEAGRALGISEGAVKVAHHRARRALQDLDRASLRPDRKAKERAREVLEKFLTAAAMGDEDGMRALLSKDALALSDGGGRYYAALNPIHGADRVARLTLGLARKRPDISSFEWVEANGEPALVLRYESGGGGRKVKLAPLLLMRAALDADGRIRALHTVLAPRKLTRLPVAG